MSLSANECAFPGCIARAVGGYECCPRHPEPGDPPHNGQEPWPPTPAHPPTEAVGAPAQNGEDASDSAGLNPPTEAVGARERGGHLASDFPPPGSAWPHEGPAEAPARLADAPAPSPGPALADQGASRYNAGKPPLHLLPPDGLVAVARVLEFGAAKYQPRGWERGELSWADCTRAILAHGLRLLGGQWLDRESGCPHAAHIATNALFLCAMASRGIGRADLPGVLPAGESDAWAQTPEQAEAIARVSAPRAQLERRAARLK